jgi:alkanesulfonate monooxygenase SsuD/methylene tetrahydromethanopterin reductase-like flavin-dependent oxidoreductase (luciferase family)
MCSQAGHSVKYGINLPNWGPYADPRVLVEVAAEAEEGGWDGVFLWDHVVWPRFAPTDPVQPVADPWVALGALALSTSRVRLGALVTPLPRRRPWKLLREVVTLDHLSGGRAVLGVGLGGFQAEEFEAFGERAEPRVRAEMLDEALELIDLLQRGEPVGHQGKHFHLKDVQLLPRPVQRPRIPVWVAGMWPNKAPFRRAARWDGVVPMSRDIMQPLTPADVIDLLAYTQAHRRASGDFDVVLSGSTSGPGDIDGVQAYADAGATWWLEDTSPWLRSVDDLRARLREGPPLV